MFFSYEEESEYYRGPRKKSVHERLTLPKRAKNLRPEPEPNYSSEEEYDEEEEEEEIVEERPKKGGSRKKSFENFKVTIRNESDGTPSLSGMDDTISSRSSSAASAASSPPRRRRRSGISNSRRPRTPPEPPARSKQRARSRSSPRRPSAAGRRRPPSPPPQRQGGGGGPPMKKKRRKKNKGRKARLRKLNLFENKNATHRENEQMIKRLNRGKKPNAQSESEKNQKLAKLAGLDLGGPSTSGGSGKTSRFRDHKRNNDKKRLKVGGMESTTTSGKRSRILLSRSKSRSPARRRNRSGNNRRRGSKSKSGSPERWSHDKFNASMTSPGPEKEEAFGSHWSQIRSERSKERDRQSRSQSRSSRSRSRKRRHSSSSSYSSRSSRGGRKGK